MALKTLNMGFTFTVELLSWLKNIPINNFATSFAGNHRQQRLAEVTVCCWMANDVIAEDHQTQVVYIINVVLLYVDTILHQSQNLHQIELIKLGM